jgi:hypothetical protein
MTKCLLVCYNIFAFYCYMDGGAITNQYLTLLFITLKSTIFFMYTQTNLNIKLKITLINIGIVYV